MSFDRFALMDSLRRHEGCVLSAYPDHLGFLTIGVGRLIDKRKGGGISQEEADYLLNNDVQRVVKDVQSRIPWVARLSDARQRVLYEMAFQLGINGLLAFQKTLQAVKDGDWRGAKAGMLDSKWAQQTAARAIELSDQMLRG